MDRMDDRMDNDWFDNINGSWCTFERLEIRQSVVRIYITIYPAIDGWMVGVVKG